MLPLKKNKIDYFIILGFFLLPITLYLRPGNLAQTINMDYLYLFVSQLIYFCFFIIFSLIIFKFFFKHKILFTDFIILNSFIFFLLFFYKKLNLLFENIDNSELFVFSGIKLSFLDNLIVVFFYLLIFVIFFNLLKKYNKESKIFLILFISLNLIFFIINSLPNFIQSSTKFDTNINSKNILKHIDNINLENIKKNNIIIIVLDGMINLDRAEKEKIINSKLKYEKILDNNGFKYLDKFRSNYQNTYLSVSALLSGDYPVIPTSPKYNNRKDFFPQMMMKNNNDFYKILNKLNINFTWIGNSWGPCTPNTFTKCLANKNKLSYYMTKVSRMYDDSIFRYFYVYYFKYFPFRDSYKVLSDKNEFYSSYETDKDENLILMHIMKPHAPYDLDENCKKIDPQESQIYEKNKKYYSYNFKCALQSSLSWSSEFIKKNQKKDNVIIILGDHGIDFNINNNIERDDRNFLQNKLNNVFFASKVPKKCSKLALPKSQVNVMRYILNCIYNTKLEYLDDKQYITRYEDHANYGKVFEFN